MTIEYWSGEDNDDEPGMCEKCNRQYSIEPGDEPTRWCHPCAQEIAADRDDAVAAARREERERVLGAIEEALKWNRSDMAYDVVRGAICRLREES